MTLLSLSLRGALLAYGLYSIGPSLHQRATVLGLLRKYPPGTVGTTHEEVITIADTVHCEDLHYHAPSGSLFAACEDNPNTRLKWFPPLALFDDPDLGARSQGSLHVIDSKTMKSRRLKFENFDGPFITHGIDVIPDTGKAGGEAVYIVAINHVPETLGSGAKAPRARSQLEVFHHVIGSPSAKHLRSVWHPLIRTPNDLFADSPTSIYVSNDHLYRDHGLMRSLEDLYTGAKWTDTVHLQLDSLTESKPDAGVTARVALSGMHNNNGLGHGRSEREILISSCTSGVMLVGQVPSGGEGNITITDSVAFTHNVDNPTYFADPYATPGDDHSGFVEAGLGRAIDLAGNQRNPDALNPVLVSYTREVSPGQWQTRVIFEDDGTRISSSSAAVLVAIDPATERTAAGGRKAWLFVTGFSSKSMIAAKVDL